MSKLSKLIKTPKLYFKDALKKHTKKRKSVEFKKTIPNEIKKTFKDNSEKFTIDSNKIKINLVIIDDLIEDLNLKKTIAKFQYRSIEKYTKFSTISYISQDIEISHGNIKSYVNYNDFHQKVTSCIYPKNEIFIFINMNFFFLRKISNSSFIKENGKTVVYIKKNKEKTFSIDEFIEPVMDGATYKFTPMENLCITNTLSLTYFEKSKVAKISVKDYLFKFLPVMQTLLFHNLLVDSPIQYARLDYGYIEKFIWIQSVHGSYRCPMAITFEHKISNQGHYKQFLESLFPHPTKTELSFSQLR